MKKPLNIRHHKFAGLIVEGLPAGRAYEQAGFSAEGSVADSCAEKLLRDVSISQLVEALRFEAAEKSGLSREAIVKALVDIIRSKPSDASMDNPLCEIKMSKTGPFAAFPDKMRCIERLCRMLGYDAPGKIDAKVTVEVIKKW